MVLRIENHTAPSTNTTEHRLNISELESSYSRTPAIHLPCSREPVAANDSSPPRHFQSNVGQQSLIEPYTKSRPINFYVFEIVTGFEETERNSSMAWAWSWGARNMFRRKPPPQPGSGPSRPTSETQSERDEFNNELFGREYDLELFEREPEPLFEFIKS